MQQTTPSASDAKTREEREGVTSFESLRREIDRLFDDFHPSSWRWPFRRGSYDLEVPRAPGSWNVLPAMDMVAKDDIYEISAELPGIEQNDVEIKVNNGILTIGGKKEEKKEESDKEFYLSERRFGSFQRSFQLPSGVDVSGIDARFVKGLLTVTIPKTAEAKESETTIAIRSE